MAISKKQIALFHTARRKTGMTDDEKQALLSGLGVASTRDLNDAQFDAAMKHFEHLGFRPQRRFYKPAGSKQRLLSKIMAQRDALGLTDTYIDAIAQNMFKDKNGAPIGSYRWCSAKQLHKVVAALTYHQARQVKTGGDAALNRQGRIEHG